MGRPRTEAVAARVAAAGTDNLSRVDKWLTKHRKPRPDTKLDATGAGLSQSPLRRTVVVVVLPLIIIGALILTVIGIVVAGYVLIFVLPPKQVIVRVGDVSYTRGDMVKLLHLRLKTLELTQAQGLRNSDDIFQALQLIVENEIISQAAPGQGISVSKEEVDNRIRTTMAPSQSESLGKSDAQIEREFNERYRQFLNTTQVGREEHRDLVRRAILREKFRQYIGDRVPAYGEQVYVHRIGMSQQDEVDIMKTKLADTIGDEKSPQNIRFAVSSAANEFSSDQFTVQSGGDLGLGPAWHTRGLRARLLGVGYRRDLRSRAQHRQPGDILLLLGIGPRRES